VLDFLSGSSDPYCQVSHGKASTQTRVLHKTVDPMWDETFVFDYQISQPLNIVVNDYDDKFFNMYDFAGQVEIILNQLKLHTPHRAWYPLLDQHSHNLKDRGEIEVVVEWIDGLMYRNTKLYVEVIQARNLQAMDLNGVSDPYALIRLGKQERQTEYQRETVAPVWNYSMRLDYDTLSKLKIELYDHDDLSIDGDDFMGQVEIPVSGLTKDQEQYGWYQLCDETGSENEDFGEIQLRIRWG